MEKKYSNEIASIIKKFLNEDDWKFFFDSEKGVFRFGLRISGKMKDIDYLIRIHETDFTVYALSPVHADNDNADCMARMAEFITRCNYGLRNGNWEMDYADGEVRYKSYVDVEGMTLSTETVKNSIYCIASMFERYGDGILSIIFGGASAEEAAKKCENSVQASDIAELLDELGIDIETEPAESAAAKLAAHFGVTIGDGDDQVSEDVESEMEPDIKIKLFEEEA